MSNVVKRHFFRLKVMSCVILLAGIMIALHGFMYTYLYQTTPINECEIHSNLKNNQRVKLDDYYVLDFVDAYGYTYYLLELPGKEYIVFETQKNGYVSDILFEQIGEYGVSESTHINGYLKHIDNDTLNTIKDSLKNKGCDLYQIEHIAEYKICYLKGNDILSIVMGVILVIVSSICLLVLRCVTNRHINEG